MIEALFLYYALGSHLTVPPPTPEHLKLIELLGNEKWPVREQASKDLAALGDAPLAALEKAVRTSEDPEIRARASRLLSRYYYIPVDRYPYIDGAHELKVTLPSTGKEITLPKGLARYYYGLVKGSFEKDWDDSVTHPVMIEATRRFIYHMRRAGMTKEDVKVILEGMLENSESMKGNWNHQFNFLDVQENYLPLPWIPF